ncbi:MAG: hypothetical protein IT463_11230 [Planctomycetes bacterium]|nr:hypothetical protein [Planctomycetota bacterium]
MPVTLTRLMLLVLALVATPVWATSVLKLDADTLAGKAERVVRAKVSSSEARWDAARTGIWTHHTITVSETLKGDAAAATEVVTRGGVVGEIGQHVAGAGSLEVGSEYVFFLWKDTDSRWQLLGMAQGALAITQKDGADWAENSLAGLTVLDPNTLQPTANEADRQPVSLKYADLKAKVAANVAANLAAGGK